MRKRDVKGRIRLLTIEERVASFWDKVVPHGECLVFTGSTNKPVDKRRGTGHGEVRWGGVKKRASHVAFFLTHGRWPKKGLVIMHSCDNPPCARGEHLIEATQADNMRDAYAKGRLHKLTPRTR